MIERLHHHGFTVSDLEKSLAFYRDLLGLEVLRVSERRNLPSYDAILGFNGVALIVALLRHPGGEFLLEFFQYLNPSVEKRPLSNHFAGASHLAFEVKDIDGQYARLRAAGYHSISPPVDVVREGKKVARAFYALDPDGISVELFEEFADLVAS